MANVVVSAIATFNGKALKKGQKDLNAFDKQAQKLGKTFNRVFATTALVAFSKKAINAFAADEQAAKSLAIQLENTGNAFRVNEVETYIASLQGLYGVLDDQLRPAFQTLLNATGSVTLSQKALETALNVSAGTGKDLASVVAAIAKGASGTTTALARLGTGLDKATIASGDMNKIMAALDKKFAGQAQARLTTYAGKMDLLKVAAADATEIIGKGLIDALTALGKDNSIDQAANSMNNFAIAIANTAKGMGELLSELKKILDSDVGKVLLGALALATLSKKIVLAGTTALIAYDIGKTQKADPSSAAARVKDYNITTKLFKAKTEEYKIIAQKNAIENKNVEELKKKFDLERIGIASALNNATDDEVKLRLKAQLAILDNNEALAKKYLAELNAIEALKALDDAARKLALAMEEAAKKMGDAAEMAYKRLALYNPVNEYGVTNSKEIKDIVESKKVTSFDPLSGLRVTQADLAATRQISTNQSPMDIRLTIDGGSDKLSQAIAESIQLATRSGYNTVPAGFLA